MLSSDSMQRNSNIQPDPVFKTQSKQVHISATKRALDDCREALKLWRLGFLLGWLDIKLRYRGSALGPFWLTITSAMMVGSMGILYGRLFGQDLRSYLPFLALSLTCWQAGIASMIHESCNCFLEADSMIRSSRLPFMLQAIRTVVRNAIVFGHNIIVPIVVFLIYGVWPGLTALWAIPGLLLWVVLGGACCMLLGVVCARFRDVPPIVGALLQVIFYITPVIWMPAQLQGKAHWLLFNPFYALLEIVRAPLLGETPSLDVWLISLGVGLVFCVMAAAVFVRTRARLVFWI
ncbi:ABC transporter permease [Swingsia samuiensis]|uniref:ABC transporter permease n=1 Tax=Swingsia samuiensis TaxID=1293412 RepID=A0A4Y6UHX5_9PROT|nr:ABC transporter permease [Swingsia samuiensis]QDH17173.1 ABC transporter permease [Swingsia samuiensis]